MVREKKSARAAGGTQTLMPEIADEIPDELTTAVNAFVKDKRALRKADDKCKVSQQTCLDLMKEHGITRVPIDLDGGDKMLILDAKESLKIKKRQSAPPAAAEDSADEE